MDSILAKCLGSDNSVPKQHNDDLEARDAYWESVLGADNAKDLHFKLQGVRYCSEYQWFVTYDLCTLDIILNPLC